VAEREVTKLTKAIADEKKHGPAQFEQLKNKIIRHEQKVAKMEKELATDHDKRKEELRHKLHRYDLFADPQVISSSFLCENMVVRFHAQAPFVKAVIDPGLMCCYARAGRSCLRATSKWTESIAHLGECVMQCFQNATERTVPEAALGWVPLLSIAAEDAHPMAWCRIQMAWCRIQ
jgi:hypothetical protein